jgi:N-acetylglucosamine-6-phosphate deacetylase
MPTRSSTLGSPLCCFTNCQLCIAGELIPGDLYFSPSTGLITPNYYYRTEGVERIDLGGRIVAPGFLELQTPGRDGVTFSELGRGDAEADVRKLETVARAMVTSGVTGWWATVPTVRADRWKEVRATAAFLVSSLLEPMS